MDKPLKLLRYNTGNDKKVFLEFKDKFDAVIFNASIVAHSRNAIADLVSVHMHKYIIDPQTYVLQHDLSVVENDRGELKESVQKYFQELPVFIGDAITAGQRIFSVAEIESHIDELVEAVVKFQLNYINGVMEKKEYNKYLDFLQISPSPKLLIAPYFMIRECYSAKESLQWLSLNRKALENTIGIVSSETPVAAQIVIDSKALLNLDCAKIGEVYNVAGYTDVFVWIDDFTPIEALPDAQKKFVELITVLNKIGKRPLMSYGGYDSIMLCHEQSPVKLYGVAQSVGYGEARQITPVGGGLPVNKYYFYPLHKRMLARDATTHLSKQGYFKIHKKLAADKYYKELCDCDECKAIIKSDINNFDEYNASVAFVTRNNIKRNRPTSDAALKADIHFMYCKVREWGELDTYTFEDLKNKFDDAKIKYYNYIDNNQLNWWKLLWTLTE